VNLPSPNVPLALFTHARVFFSTPFLRMAEQCGLFMGEHARYLSPKDFKNFLKGTHAWGTNGGSRGISFLGFVSTKGMMMGCHSTKNCKSLIFIIAYSNN